MRPERSISPVGILLILAGLGPLAGYLLFLMYRAQEMLARSPQPGW